MCNKLLRLLEKTLFSCVYFFLDTLIKANVVKLFSSPPRPEEVKRRVASPKQTTT